MTEAYAAIISVAVTSIVTIIFSFISHFNQKNNFYSTTITKERALWLSDMRKLCAELNAFCCAKANKELDDDEIKEFEFIRSSILVRISPANSDYEIDNKLRTALEYVPFCDVSKNIDTIREYITQLCKDEWDKIKAEAGRDQHLSNRIRKLQHAAKHKSNKK